MQAGTLSGGFTDPAIGSARAFRGVMEAMARPGTIRETTALSLPEPGAFWAGRALFTLGLDVIFTAGTRVAALPRSTVVAEGHAGPVTREGGA